MKWTWLSVGSLLLALLASPALAQEPPPGGSAGLLQLGLEPQFGDLSEIAERGHLRVLTTFSKTHYFLDGPRPRGITYEAMEKFRESLNERLGRKSRPITFVYLALPRDALIPYLLEGRGDLIAANLTITPERKQQVDFSTPVLTGVRELLVTGPAMPGIRSVEDLAGKTITVRGSASYREHLEALNQGLVAKGLAPIEIEAADERLEDEDILELVNAGLHEATLVDDHVATLWADVFDQLVVHEDIAIHEGGEIANAVRKNSPQLVEALDEFARANKKGTLFGNVIFKRYLRNNRWVRSPVAQAQREDFLQLRELFTRYGDKYDFEWLLLAAQAYQESGLDHSKRSAAGAVGIMQVLPSTASSHEVGIPDVEDLESNIHAGAKYLRYVADRYFSDPGIDKIDQMLFAFAAYNAGPNRIQRLRKQAAEVGLDPDQWYGNVELVVAQKVGREPVQYVGNISKYYVAYKLIVEKEQEREKLRDPTAP